MAGYDGQKNAVKERKRRKFPVFWCLYLLFVAAMLVFWFCVADYVKRGLVRYEENQPDRKIEEIMDRLRETGLEGYLTVEEDISRFETPEVYSREFHDRVDGAILFCTSARDQQSTSAPRYELYANGDLVGYINLKEVSSQPLLVFLTLSQWDLDTVEIIPPTASESVQVTVPEAYLVRINGQQADQRERSGDPETSEEFEYVASYVEVPKLVTYEADGLLERPVVTVYDQNGAPVSCQEEYEDGRLRVFVSQMQETEMPQELREMALKNAERYTNFFSADLPGCKSSVKPIQDMFPEDSYYLDLAETYRREDMWMYSAHSAPEFQNEKVEAYIRYSEELFSCEVSFDKNMYLTRVGSTRTDTTHSRFYYGLLNGEWKILDIKTLLEEEQEE